MPCCAQQRRAAPRGAGSLLRTRAAGSRWGSWLGSRASAGRSRAPRALPALASSPLSSPAAAQQPLGLSSAPGDKIQLPVASPARAFAFLGERSPQAPARAQGRAIRPGARAAPGTWEAPCSGLTTAALSPVPRRMDRSPARRAGQDDVGRGVAGPPARAPATTGEQRAAPGPHPRRGRADPTRGGAEQADRKALGRPGDGS